MIGDNYNDETFYEWETASGIRWSEIVSKDIHTKYKGDVEIGKPHGVGV